MNRTKEHFREWSQLSLSWPERLEILKLSILPQYLFLFQSLPVAIPISSLNTWQKDFVCFIWQKNPHRINKQFLSRPKKLGGYGLPLLENYYLAAQLRFIYTYLTSSESLGWMQIEEFCIRPRRMKELIWHNKASKLVDVNSNPFLHLTLRLWDRHRTKMIHHPSVAATFLGQEWFPPASSLKDFKIWRSKGIWRFHDVMTRNKLLTKLQMEQKFETQIPWY